MIIEILDNNPESGKRKGRTKTKSKIRTSAAVLSMVRVAMFAAIIAALSQIAIPMPGGVPVTLQTFAVALCGYFLGKRDGVCAVAVYILLGVCGLPVFSGFQGGIQRIAGITGGFIVGFLFLALLCGCGMMPGARRKSGTANAKSAAETAAAAKADHPVAAILCGAAGIAVCHALGVLWFAFVGHTTLLAAFFAASSGFLVKDILSCAAAYFLCRLLKKRIG